ncbi:MbcA/ParS/Xre antitoxin family protein [Caulobacter sp. UNC358MFTsu5.1]|nr:MbcA/ParS/Xre antitoxin family protein [Caulobacter sp. UNC358MFTsu5.1]
MIPSPWLGDWLRSPLPAFGGACPMDFLDTMEGQALISGTLERLESGAYS